MIVTIAHSGELMNMERYNKILKKIYDEDMDVLLNPLEHPTKIFKIFGGVTYSMPGEECTSFHYTCANIDTWDNIHIDDAASLFNEYKQYEHHKYVYKIRPYYSGIVSIEDFKYDELDDDVIVPIYEYNDKDEEIKNLLNHNNIVPLYQYDYEEIRKIMDDRISMLYNISLYPIVDNVYLFLQQRQITPFENEVLNNLQESVDECYSLNIDYVDDEMYRSNHKILYDVILQYTLKYLYKSDIIRVSQEELCATLPPGIYYNFVCRSNEETRNVLYNDNNHSKIISIPAYMKQFEETGNVKYRKAAAAVVKRVKNFSRKKQARNAENRTYRSLKKYRRHSIH